MKSCLRLLLRRPWAAVVPLGLLLLIGCGKPAVKFQVKSLTKDDVSKIDQWTNWQSRSPETTYERQTKFQQKVKWESWGPEKGNGNVKMHGKPSKWPGPHTMANQTEDRLPRYPRVFRCTLSRNDLGGIDTITGKKISEYDLYDIGAQRNVEDVDIEVVTGDDVHFTQRDNVPGPAPVDSSTKMHSIRAGAYDRKNNYPTAGVTLTFTGDTCVFVIRRAPHGGMQPDGSDGSPPPPNPGDDITEDP